MHYRPGVLTFTCIITSKAHFGKTLMYGPTLPLCDQIVFAENKLKHVKLVPAE